MNPCVQCLVELGAGRRKRVLVPSGDGMDDREYVNNHGVDDREEIYNYLRSEGIQFY